ncbi:MAG: hypothetical protein ACLFMT_02595 [Halobacteriales archaeon]
MDLDRLRRAQAAERESQSLQPLEDSFYGDAADFVVDLERRRREAGDPSSEEAQRLNDAVVSARRFAEAVYERRVGKIVNMASLAANGAEVDTSKLTEEERDLFDSISGAIEAHGDRVMDVLSGSTQRELDEAGDADDVKSTGGREIAGAAAGDVTGDDVEDTDAGSDGDEDAGAGTSPKPEREHATESEAGDPARGGLEGYRTVRVTDDIPAFVGVDGREYELSPQEVASVPEENAEALVERGAAVEVE